MATTSISSTELLWIFREKLSSFGDGFKDAPIAIVPSKDGWEVVTSHRYRNAELQLAKCIAKIQAELRPVYRQPMTVAPFRRSSGVLCAISAPNSTGRLGAIARSWRGCLMPRLPKGSAN